MTSRDLDEAMLETRHFWFDFPDEYDNAWQPILDVYSQAERWPTIPPPSREVCLSTLLHTKDSAPGPDGIPYSAWRVLPEMTLQAMSSGAKVELPVSLPALANLDGTHWAPHWLAPAVAFRNGAAPAPLLSAKKYTSWGCGDI